MGNNPLRPAATATKRTFVAHASHSGCALSPNRSVSITSPLSIVPASSPTRVVLPAAGAPVTRRNGFSVEVTGQNVLAERGCLIKPGRRQVKE